MPNKKSRAAAIANDDGSEPSRIAAVLVAFLRLLARRPHDTAAGLVAIVACGAILVNALFLQSGHHPYPIFPNTPPAPPAAAVDALPVGNPVLPRPRPPEGGTADDAARHAPANRDTAQRPPAPRSGLGEARPQPDPIAELLAGASRLMAVQKTLTDFGYGQIKATGMLDKATADAIEKFERSHKMPVTGRVSDRLVRELSAMSGRALN